MATSLIAFGANLGNRTDSLDRAVKRLSEHPLVEVTVCSRPHQTKPVGGPPGQDDFLNAALLINTTLSPRQLLKLLQDAEAELGRERVERWGQRTIDLDLLLCGEEVVNADAHGELTVPHPRMALRRFVLAPAAEVAPAMRHPVIGWTVAELLQHLDHAPPCIAICAASSARAAGLAAEVIQRTGAELISTDDETVLLWDAAAAQAESFAPLADHPPKFTVLDHAADSQTQGPVLNICGMTDHEAVTDIVAAIEAMRE